MATLYPYAFGVSRDKETCKKIFERWDLEYGISTVEYLSDDIYAVELPAYVTVECFFSLSRAEKYA